MFDLSQPPSYYYDILVRYLNVENGIDRNAIKDTCQGMYDIIKASSEGLDETVIQYSAIIETADILGSLKDFVYHVMDYRKEVGHTLGANIKGELPNKPA